VARVITYAVVALLALAAVALTPPLAKRRAALSTRGHADPPRTDSMPTPVAQVHETTDTLGRGESLSHLFARAGVPGATAAAVLHAAPSVDERRVPAGLEVIIDRLPGDSVPTAITFRFAIDHLLHLTRTATGWTATDERLPWTTDTVVAAGTIHANVYEALDAGASQILPKSARAELAWAMADVLEYRVDMSRDLQVGDAFRALFERQTGPQGVVRIGRVLAMTFVLSGDTTEAMWFAGGASKDGYFDREGKSLRNAFLRAPLEFRRISSVFGMRKHPILGVWRQHKGTDYAAAQGTPVRAIGDGVVIFAGQKHGYGNVVDLRHRNGYVTRYGHLSRFAAGTRVGARVGIGKTIAYVGMTGLATAPHLHFEVLVNGVQRDPRQALKSKSGDPLVAADRPAFDALRARYLAALRSPDGPVRLAAS
jgi:murein DD-endopeptidase MepM/ murein hydrolase activator NlpD